MFKEVTMSGSIRVGVVLPETHWADEEWKNAEPALAYADEAEKKESSFSSSPRDIPDR
jgi:hypothetical protein